MNTQLDLWAALTTLHEVSIETANDVLRRHHYLGTVSRGTALRDARGVLVLANPSSRRLPHARWLELTRWCLVGADRNAGSRQWAGVVRWLLVHRPDVSTVVSYSDPAAGHTGALYRASNWRWAPTWHRLRPPPSGHGKWSDKQETVKDRWVYPLREDADRARILAISDSAITRKMPWASYREPVFRRGCATGGGGDYRRWIELTQALKEAV